MGRITWTFEENGDFKRLDNATGIWEFINEVDLKITLNQNNSDSIYIYQILRLAKDELWLTAEEAVEMGVMDELWLKPVEG